MLSPLRSDRFLRGEPIGLRAEGISLRMTLCRGEWMLGRMRSGEGSFVVQNDGPAALVTLAGRCYIDGVIALCLEWGWYPLFFGLVPGRRWEEMPA